MTRALALVTLQSPVSDMLLEDAAKCKAAAEWLEDVTKAVGNEAVVAKDVASLAACLKTAADLRKQAAASLSAAKEQYSNERAAGMGLNGASLRSPNVQKLLSHAGKLIAAAEKDRDKDLVGAKPAEVF